MSLDKGNPSGESSSSDKKPVQRAATAPGKRSRTSGLSGSSGSSGGGAVQRKGGGAESAAGASGPGSADGGSEGWMDVAMRPDLHASSVQMKASTPGTTDVHSAAADGISGASSSLPHAGAIQKSFGHHDVSNIQAHTDSKAAKASESMGAEAYATGSHVAFGTSPNLHTAAHEAAHVVQQRGTVQLSGGVGQVGDSYEQHADAVADRVVAGQSAEGLLDEMATGGSSTPAVQALQMSIKEDLREAMSGWGTDEDAIYSRLRRASQAELQQVLGDSGLMAELRDELNQSEMSRVLDMLQAPVADKLRLAMQGWGTDEGYIHRTLANASAAELQAVANDNALVTALEGELSGEDLRRVLNRLNVPLERKLRMAIRGWGTDEAYIFDSIASAPVAQVVSAAQDSGLMSALDSDLSGAEQAQCRGAMARRVHLEGGNASVAFSLLMSSNDDARNARLAQYGSLAEQRTLTDQIITAGGAIATLTQAFEAYWGVDTSVEAAASGWTVADIQRVHTQCKVLPEQDVRSGGWTSLIQISGTGGSMSSAGDFKIGDGVVGVGTQPYGVGTELSAAAAAGDTTITVKDGAVFQTNDTIAMGSRPSADVKQITAVSGNQYTLNSALSQAWGNATRVTPDDITAVRDVQWLEAVVRHEIAHAVDNVVGASGFYALGGWWSGDSFDSWASAMGSPWSTNDGSTISDEDKTAIKNAIVAAKGGSGGAAINVGLAADHAINRHWTKGVPVIQAANASISRGQRYWQNPEVVPSYNSQRFAVNMYYKKFQYYNEEVHSSRVRAYSIFSPAEFFAEVYTVYYEEAGAVPDSDLGRLVPVGSWRNWIANNVHNRGHGPSTGSPTSPSAGVAANNPGM